MQANNYLSDFFECTKKDAILGPGHIALYAAILKCWLEQEQKFPVIIFGYSLRRLAKISGRATYHKLINDLTDQGYIQYKPSRDPRKGSEIIVELKLKVKGDECGDCNQRRPSTIEDSIDG